MSFAKNHKMIKQTKIVSDVKREKFFEILKANHIQKLLGDANQRMQN